MTDDNKETRRLYHRLYSHWPVIIMLIHLDVIDEEVTAMKSDDMLEVRQLMDEKIPLWK